MLEKRESREVKTSFKVPKNCISKLMSPHPINTIPTQKGRFLASCTCSRCTELKDKLARMYYSHQKEIAQDISVVSKLPTGEFYKEDLMKILHKEPQLVLCKNWTELETDGIEQKNTTCISYNDSADSTDNSSKDSKRYYSKGEIKIFLCLCSLVNNSTGFLQYVDLIKLKEMTLLSISTIRKCLNVLQNTGLIIFNYPLGREDMLYIDVLITDYADSLKKKSENSSNKKIGGYLILSGTELTNILAITRKITLLTVLHCFNLCDAKRDSSRDASVYTSTISKSMCGYVRPSMVKVAMDSDEFANIFDLLSSTVKRDVSDKIEDNGNLSKHRTWPKTINVFARLVNVKELIKVAIAETKENLIKLVVYQSKDVYERFLSLTNSVDEEKAKKDVFQKIASLAEIYNPDLVIDNFRKVLFRDDIDDYPSYISRMCEFGFFESWNAS